MSRRLKDEELPLVRAVFAKAGLLVADSLRVDEMADGGMGSLLFRRGASIAKFAVSEVFFLDEDGVLVTATLNSTAEDQPVELDVWKVDYKPLKRWPSEAEIFDTPPN
jgi:hypothetical protein